MRTPVPGFFSLFRSPLTLSLLLLLVTQPAAAKGPHKSKLPEALRDMAETAGAMADPARKIAAQAAEEARRETERQVHLLASGAAKEAQKAAIMAGDAQRRLAEYDQSAANGLLKDTARNRKELKSIIEKTGRLAQEAGRAAGRVSGGAPEAIRRTSEALRESSERLSKQAEGAIQDVKDYFGYLATRPWKLDTAKSWKMIDGLAERLDDITRGISHSLNRGTRPLLAAMEADVRMIHDDRKEIDRLLARAERIVREESFPGAPEAPDADAAPVLSEEGRRDPPAYLPKFDTERLHRKLLASQGQEVKAYRAILLSKMQEVERRFEKERPPPPSSDPLASDPEPTPKILM
jgi:hypothetical protein